MQVSEYPVAFVVAMGGALSFVALELVGGCSALFAT